MRQLTIYILHKCKYKKIKIKDYFKLFDCVNISCSLHIILF